MKKVRKKCISADQLKPWYDKVQNKLWALLAGYKYVSAMVFFESIVLKWSDNSRKKEFVRSGLFNITPYRSTYLKRPALDYLIRRIYMSFEGPWQSESFPSSLGCCACVVYNGVTFVCLNDLTLNFGWLVHSLTCRHGLCYVCNNYNYFINTSSQEFKSLQPLLLPLNMYKWCQKERDLWFKIRKNTHSKRSELLNFRWGKIPL